jgi:hypothetical protein
MHADGSFTYTPNSGFTGSDGFTFTVSDGIQSATGTVELDVVTQSLTAQDIGYILPHDQTLTAAVNGSTGAWGLLHWQSGLDSSALTITALNGYALTGSSTVGLAYGILTLNSDGSFSLLCPSCWQDELSVIFTTPEYGYEHG